MLTSLFCEKCHKQFDHEEGMNSSLCVECLFPDITEATKPSQLEVILKPEILDTSVLKIGEGSQEFRPTTWNEYIGQTSAKEKVKSYVEGCKKFNEVYPHTFLSAPSGMGKTLFSTILANQLEKNIIFTTGGELKSEQIFIDKLVLCDGGVIMVDEANRLPKKVGFFILPLMEQFCIDDKPLKKFTLFFSTTHKGDISKDLDALIQRCEQINLEPYTTSELIQICKQYHVKQYSNIKISDETFNAIVDNCRQTPRNAKNLVRSYAYVQDWNKIKEYNNIVKEGLTKTDIRALRYLETTKGAGANNIANALRMKIQTYLFEIEPYLMFKELIEVENKRVLSNKGYEFLGGLKNGI